MQFRHPTALFCRPCDLQAVQESENDKAEICIVCEPEGMSLQMGGLHPRASLYEKPVNLEAARKAHAEFRKVSWQRGGGPWHVEGLGGWVGRDGAGRLAGHGVCTGGA